MSLSTVSGTPDVVPITLVPLLPSPCEERWIPEEGLGPRSTPTPPPSVPVHSF